MLSETFLRKTLFARGAIHFCEKKIISKDEFRLLLTKGKYTPARFHMTQSEADTYMNSLRRSKMIVEVDSYVYTDPLTVVDAVHLKSGLPLLPGAARELEVTRHALTRKVVESQNASKPAVEKSVRREKEFWALTALASGLQMLVLSYLTFQVYGWDVMEPVTYFVSTATALCAYAYFLYSRTEHSYEHVDDSFLPRRLAKELRRSRVDAQQMNRDIQFLRELEIVVVRDSKRISKLIEEAVQRK